MSWPGSTLPTGVKRRRRGKRRKGISGSDRPLRKIAIAQGLAPKPKSKWKDVVGVCADHVDYAAMGFASLADLILYIDALSRRGHKQARTVRLPRVKCPPGVLRVVAVRCTACRPNSFCVRCSGWGYGLRFYRGRKETKCPHQPALQPLIDAAMTATTPTQLDAIAAGRIADAAEAKLTTT